MWSRQKHLFSLSMLRAGTVPSMAVRRDKSTSITTLQFGKVGQCRLTSVSSLRTRGFIATACPSAMLTLWGCVFGFLIGCRSFRSQVSEGKMSKSASSRSSKLDRRPDVGLFCADIFRTSCPKRPSTESCRLSVILKAVHFNRTQSLRMSSAGLGISTEHFKLLAVLSMRLNNGVKS